MIKKILIIKHGAFGDIIKALPVINSLHHHFKDTSISLLTSPKFTALHQLFFDYESIFNDIRSHNIVHTLKLLYLIKQQNFDLIIDLQNSKRTNRYYYILKYLFGYTGLWSGTARGCEYYMPHKKKKIVHTLDRFNHQLKSLKINMLPYDGKSLTHLENFDHLLLPKKFVLMIPGCSAVSPEKRWPISHYITLSHLLKNFEVDSVFIGGPEETELSQGITQQCPDAINLINKLSFQDILNIAQRTQVIVGNDTGPLYLAQLSNQPTCVLWSNHSDSNLHAPRGHNVHILQSTCINDISPDQVMICIKAYIQ